MNFKFLIEQKKIFSSSLSNWQKIVLEQFNNQLINKKFPCIFALSSFNSKGILFLFVDKNTNSILTDGILEYTNFVKSTNVKDRIRNPLVIFFEQKFTTLFDEHVFAWKKINHLHQNDPENWIDDIPKDPQSSGFTFCFNKVQLFFNVSCPHHIVLKNRNLGDNITFIVNPRENFDFVAPNNTKKDLIQEH
ncbi:MAG: YqcI/YcgG family protein [Neisseriaceae bacterium]|nr:YqcI/YcgG family protein [Neisseriaceae bacterium]